MRHRRSEDREGRGPERKKARRGNDVTTCPGPGARGSREVFRCKAAKTQPGSRMESMVVLALGWHGDAPVQAVDDVAMLIANRERDAVIIEEQEDRSRAKMARATLLGAHSTASSSAAIGADHEVTPPTAKVVSREGDDTALAASTPSSLFGQTRKKKSTAAETPQVGDRGAVQAASTKAEAPVGTPAAAKNAKSQKAGAPGAKEETLKGMSTASKSVKRTSMTTEKETSRETTAKMTSREEREPAKKDDTAVLTSVTVSLTKLKKGDEPQQKGSPVASTSAAKSKKKTVAPVKTSETKKKQAIELKKADDEATTTAFKEPKENPVKITKKKSETTPAAPSSAGGTSLDLGRVDETFRCDRQRRRAAQDAARKRIEEAQQEKKRLLERIKTIDADIQAQTEVIARVEEEIGDAEKDYAAYLQQTAQFMASLWKKKD